MLPDKLFRHLPAVSQHPFLHRLKHLIGCLQPCPVNVILAISELAHIMAAIKAPFTAAQDSPKRNSTTEESTSEFLTFSAHDLFMRGEQSNQKRKSPQVGGFMCVWKFLSSTIPSHLITPGALALVVCQKLWCCRLCLYLYLCPLSPHVGLQSLSRLPHPALENLCNLNGSYFGPDCTNTSWIWRLGRA